MNIFDDANVPTPEECFEELRFSDRLKALKKECSRLESTVTSLRYIEQTLRDDIVRLSSTLSQLYALAGNLTQSGMPKDEE